MKKNRGSSLEESSTNPGSVTLRVTAKVIESPLQLNDIFMRLKYLYFIFFLFSLFGANAQVSFNIIPPRDVVAGQQFRVVYRLSNAQGSSLNAPTVPGCTLRFGPSTSTSMSTQIINGQTSTSSTIDYSYVYIADKEGEYTIPAATIIVDGKTLTADAKKFRILPPDKTNPNNQSQVSATDRNSQTVDRPIGKDDIFVRVILNKSSAFENEAIECTLKLYTKYESIASFNATSTPTYEGFLVEDVPVQAELNALENYNGQNYRTAVLRRYILYPQKTGSLTVTSGSYDIVVQQLERINQGYFYYTRPIEKRVKLSEYTAKVNVNPLPSPAPAGFDGAVGKFSITSKLSSTELKTNEAAILTYTIDGTGNIKFLKDPSPTLPTEFELYNPSHDVTAKVAGANMTGKMTSEFTFVPQYPGTFEIPPYSFVYFNPTTAKYETVMADGFAVNVAKGASSPSQNVGETPGLKAKNTDIRHIHQGDKNLSKQHSYIIESPIYWATFVVLTLILIALSIILSHQNKKRADVDRMRVTKANKVARRHLRVAEKQIGSNNTEAFYEALLKALWGYLGDKLNIPASELVRGNIAEKLTEYGASEELISETLSLIDDCEMARYTPNSPELAPKQLYNKATDVIKQLEAVK